MLSEPSPSKSRIRTPGSGSNAGEGKEAVAAITGSLCIGSTTGSKPRPELPIGPRIGPPDEIRQPIAIDVQKQINRTGDHVARGVGDVDLLSRNQSERRGALLTIRVDRKCVVRRKVARPDARSVRRLHPQQQFVGAITVDVDELDILIAYGDRAGGGLNLNG